MKARRVGLNDVVDTRGCQSAFELDFQVGKDHEVLIGLLDPAFEGMKTFASVGSSKVFQKLGDNWGDFIDMEKFVECCLTRIDLQDEFLFKPFFYETLLIRVTLRFEL